jgi:phosphatidylglycerophosphate synthase
MLERFLLWYEAQKQHYAPVPRRPYEYPINRFYAHKVDLVLTWAADRLGLSPNFVTLISMACGVGAGFAIYQGFFIIGAVLIQAHHLLDGVDGNLARANKQCSDFGKWLDIVSDQLTRLSILVGLGFASGANIILVSALFFTFYFDLFIVHFYINPKIQKYGVKRQRWKEWFMSHGLMPGFDIFTLYFLISIFLLLNQPWVALISILILKTIDWGYRLYEIHGPILFAPHRWGNKTSKN